ncbi:AMP-binding protein [Klenkia terrae]|uniref:AMP-binding protein n=1 Tax=Klenkia terrae TaxID=1052259 RepID=UPI00361A65C9
MVFDSTGIQRGADGIARYEGLLPNVVRGFADTVAAHPDRTAVVELGGGTATYRELWDRALRVAGGLRAAGWDRATGSPSGCRTGWPGCSGSGAPSWPAPSSSR